MKKIIGAASGLAAVVGTVLHYGVANIAEIQGILLPLAFTVAPRVPYLDAATLQKAAIGLTVAVVVVSAGRWVAKGIRRMS